MRILISFLFSLIGLIDFAQADYIKITRTMVVIDKISNIIPKVIYVCTWNIKEPIVNRYEFTSSEPDIQFNVDFPANEIEVEDLKSRNIEPSVEYFEDIKVIYES